MAADNADDEPQDGSKKARGKGVKDTIRWFDVLEPFAKAGGKKFCRYPLSEKVDKGQLDHEKMKKCWPVVKEVREKYQTRT